MEHHETTLREPSLWERARRRLRIVHTVGLVDLVLLITLVTASVTGNRELVSILGPLHGGSYLLLLTLAITGAADGMWRWWFPLVILVTGGPPGALIGEWLIGRQIAAQAVALNTAMDPSPGAPDAAATEHQ
ncbi:MAG: hypothetical protein MI924_09505 [Chloroflexales bacterium]|nr:hypothetical protein [Chloroflexales bacterium]